jgi:hypothetical protein
MLYTPVHREVEKDEQRRPIETVHRCEDDK